MTPSQKDIDKLELCGPPEWMALQYDNYRLCQSDNWPDKTSPAGRGVFVFDPGIEDIGPLIETARKSRIMSVLCAPDLSSDFVARAEKSGFGVTPGTLLRHDRAQGLAAVDALLDSPPDVCRDAALVRIDPTTEANVLRDLQELYLQNGIKPFPGWFLRGETDAVSYVLLNRDEKESSEKVIASVTLVPCGRAGAAYKDVVRVNGLVTAPGWRGRGLAGWMMALAMRSAYDDIAARTLLDYTDGVRQSDDPALKTPIKCGFQIDESRRFFYIKNL